jgi:hypothetical protein
VARNIRLSSAEALDAAGEIAKIVLLCSATAGLVIMLFPKVGSWYNLTAEGLTCVSASALALLLFRPNLRRLLREEIAHLVRPARA